MGRQPQRCFAHFYPTLISLTLRKRSGHHRLVFEFALQFPNLENLCLESFKDEKTVPQHLAVPDIVGQSPPLRGHLQLGGNVLRTQWLNESAFKPPNWINFRLIKLQ